MMEQSSADNQNIITIPYNSIPTVLNTDQIKQINAQSQKGYLTIQEFVKTAGLNGVVASVSILPGDDPPLSITDIKINNKTIYPLDKSKGGRKSSVSRGGRKSRVSTRRGIGGRKSRRKRNYI